MCVCVCMCACACACVCVYVHACVCVCVCMCVWETYELHPYWKFSNVLHFIIFWRGIRFANHIAEPTICGYNTGNPWLLQHNDTALLWHINIDTADYEFIMKAKESTKCHQTLSSQVGSSLVLRPHPKIGKEPGHTCANFIVCADSAYQRVGRLSM